MVTNKMSNMKKYFNPKKRSFLCQQECQVLIEEHVRLKTFTSSWKANFIDIRELAEAGFFYTGLGDQVQCAFCGVVIYHFEEGDVPMEEHRRHFERCCFVQGFEPFSLPPASGGISTGLFLYMGDSFPYIQSIILQEVMNNFLANSGIYPHCGPKHPSKSTFEARLKTFANWNYSDRMDPSKLAEAGFFYLGVSDKVNCFHCDNSLDRWKVTDDPWVEHARWFSECLFLIHSIENIFEEEVKDSFKRKAETENTESQRRLEKKLKTEIPNKPKRMNVDMSEEVIEERYKCRVCLDKRVEYIYLPCGHLASCSICTLVLANCPLCRQAIGYTAKVFLP
ncbi:E3 ubiquitin-protein ligase XIAP-like [Artemia franciscana]